MNEMIEFHVELLDIADRLERIAQRVESSEVKDPLNRLEEAATQIGKASSGSWFGYHARVYYKNLEPPPPGAHFSPEWGMMDTFVAETIGEWEEFNEDHVAKAIHDLSCKS